MQNRSRPGNSEFPPYNENYIKTVEGNDLVSAMHIANEKFNSIVGKLTDNQARQSYAPGKWSVLDMVQHIIDTEWVFNYRAMRFARKDKTELPGFDHDEFVKHALANNRKIGSQLEDLNQLRSGSIRLFESFDDEALLNLGVANGQKISVRAIGWVISGHQLHHLNILEERYLPVIK